MPSPGYQAALQRVLSQEEQQRMQEYVGTPERLSALRDACLVRDRHRCVVSRAFDKDEALKRIDASVKAGGQDPPVDDDGSPLAGESLEYLQVAHIIPYALTKANDDGQIDEPRRAAITILNMFDLGVVYLLEGVDMNRPYNALSMRDVMHRDFGRFKIFFERRPEHDGSGHVYRIGTFLHPIAMPSFPITRTLFVHPTIDPPSERLLALHYAIAHILHLSGAGEYIDKILKDMEDGFVREDGSTSLGVMVDLALRACSL